MKDENNRDILEKIAEVEERICELEERVALLEGLVNFRSTTGGENDE